MKEIGGAGRNTAGGADRAPSVMRVGSKTKYIDLVIWFDVVLDPIAGLFFEKHVALISAAQAIARDDRGRADRRAHPQELFLAGRRCGNVSAFVK